MDPKQRNVVSLVVIVALVAASWAMLLPFRGPDYLQYQANDAKGNSTTKQQLLKTPAWSFDAAGVVREGAPDGSSATLKRTAGSGNSVGLSEWTVAPSSSATLTLDREKTSGSKQLSYGDKLQLNSGPEYGLHEGRTRITLGLDIQGGLSIILKATETSASPLNSDVMSRAELIVRNRIDKLGASEATIQRQGQDSILVQIPGARNAEQALDVIGRTGQLSFVEVSTIEDTAAVLAIQSGQDGVQLKKGTYKPFLTGEVIKTASISQATDTGEIEVNVTMDATGAKIWGDVTTRLAPTQSQVAIVLDDVVQSAPQVQSAITDGRTRITGKFTIDRAKALKTVLETGALPVTLEPVESRVVGPKLGQESLRQGIWAVLIGLALVALYLIVFYRGLGLVSVSALVVFSSIFLGILAVLSKFGLFALSLPGIAGIVLTIGIAADSSILINERVREEVRMGKTLRSAANSGSKHGIMTSVDADLVTFVSALALFFVAIGPVKGFALTLMIGIICDISMMLLYKRPVIMLLAESVIPKAPAFWGMPRETVAVTPASAKKGGGRRG